MPDLEHDPLLVVVSIDNADSFKEDGNRNFKNKKYRWAIDNYTAGIKEMCKNRELNAILYCNRAAAHFHLGELYFDIVLKFAMCIVFDN